MDVDPPDAIEMSPTAGVSAVNSIASPDKILTFNAASIEINPASDPNSIAPPALISTAATIVAVRSADSISIAPPGLIVTAPPPISIVVALNRPIPPGTRASIFISVAEFNPIPSIPAFNEITRAGSPSSLPTWNVVGNEMKSGLSKLVSTP